MLVCNLYVLFVAYAASMSALVMETARFYLVWLTKKLFSFPVFVIFVVLANYNKFDAL